MPEIPFQEIPTSTPAQKLICPEASLGRRQQGFEYYLSTMTPAEVKELHQGYLLDYVSRFGNPKNAHTATISPGLAVVGSAIMGNEGGEMSRRDFLKKASLAVAGATLPKPPTNELSPQLFQGTEFGAFAAKGMAWKLLMQIKNEFGDDLANLNALAYYHTQDVTLEKEGNYKEAQKVFERIADSLLKLGAAKALNEVRAKKNTAHRLDGVRDVIDDVILHHDQDISQFNKHFSTSTEGLTEDEWVKGKRGDSNWFPENYVWRIMIGEDGANVRNGPSAMRNETITDSKKPGEEITFGYVIDTDKYANSNLIPHRWIVARRDDLHLPLRPWDNKTELSFVAQTMSTNFTYSK